MNDNTTPPLDLDALIERARIEATGLRSSDAAIARVVRLLAEGDGFLPVALLLQQGVPRDVLASLVAEPTDKRARAKARLGVVGSDPWVWLTATGWQSAGRASGRERAPDAMTANHAMAPRGLADWLDLRQQTLARTGVRASVVSGAAVRRFSEEVSSRAWAALKSDADGEGAIGLLTGGWIPDALCLTRWPATPEGRALYRRCWGQDGSDEDLAESIAAVEVEDTRKSADPLRSKTTAAAVAVSSLRVAQAVVWVVRTREVADRLRDLGVDDVARQPSQYLVDARTVGLTGEDIGAIVRPWWPTAVPPDAGS